MTDPKDEGLSGTSLKRYTQTSGALVETFQGTFEGPRTPSGEWVRYADVQARIEELEREIVSARKLVPSEPPHEHCWHGTGIMLTSMPPQTEEVCCRCAQKRYLRLAVPIEQGRHGPYAPR